MIDKHRIGIALIAAALASSAPHALAQESEDNGTEEVEETEPMPQIDETRAETDVSMEIGPSDGAPADPPPEPSQETVVEPTILVHVMAGVLIPQVFNLLDTSFTVSLGVGYVLPFLDHRLAIVLDGFYTRPERSEELMDPRLTSGSYRYTLTQNMVSLFLGVHIHFTDLVRDMIIPYAGLGARVYFMWSDIDGTSGDGSTGFHRETSTQGGGAIRLGVGLRLGPGMLALEVEGALTPIDHLVTGNANAGDLGIALGYRLVL